MNKYLSSILATTFIYSGAAYAATTASAVTSTSQTKAATTSATPPKGSTSPAVTKAVASGTAASSTDTVTVSEGVACGTGTACLVVSDTTNKAIDLINKDASSQITNMITSQFDFTLMTRYAMGNNWKLATPEQQTKLVSLFRQLLVYTYSAALSKFKGTKTNITSATVTTPDPKRPDIQKTAVVSQVTLANSGNNNPIKVEYDLANNTGSWKAYDIKIENASLVTTYRTQFNEVVQNGKIPGLIKQLQEKVDSLQKTGAKTE